MAKALSWKSVLVVGVALFTVHIIATLNSWYWIIPWFDMPMHFWGGILAGLLFYLFFARVVLEGSLKENLFMNLILVASFAALVGVVWEWFEYCYDIFFNSSKLIYSAGILSDTLSDLFFDVLGGVSLALGVMVIYNYKRKVPIKK